MIRAALTLPLLLVACGGAKTICGTREAQALDPAINDEIAAAVHYWEDQGESGLVATDGHNCDIPVRPAPVSDALAHARTLHSIFDGPGECWPDYVEVDPEAWRELMAKQRTVRALAHEFGHLHCYSDADTGVMSTDLDHPSLAEYQPELRPAPMPEPAEPGVQTICVTAATHEADPTVSERLRVALVYWQGTPWVELLRWTEPGDCDVPVEFAELPDGETARALVDDCAPRGIQLQQSAWSNLRLNGLDFVVVAHEVGHLLCQPHVEVGLMAPSVVAGVD